MREQIAILVDGTVVPCCLDHEGIINLGNVKDQSLEDILQGKRARELYNGFTGKRWLSPYAENVVIENALVTDRLWYNSIRSIDPG